MHAQQPMHFAYSMNTMPSGRLCVAFVGHTWAQTGTSQWLQSTGTKTRLQCGNVPISFSSTVVNSTPFGVLCSDLHATTHALQPTHRFRSTTIPYLAMAISPLPCRP